MIGICIFTGPELVVDLQVGEIKTKSISLTWSAKKRSHQDKYLVWCQPINENGRREERKVTDTQITLEGLEPGVQYEVEVMAISLDQTSGAVAVTVNTCMYLL